MFWWIIVGVSGISFTSSVIIGTRNSWSGVKYKIKTLLSLSICLALIVFTINMNNKANSNIQQMINEKEFIEDNWGTTDDLLAIYVNNNYFEYNFKLEQMKESQKNLEVFSMYSDIDLKTLELKLPEKTN